LNVKICFLNFKLIRRVGISFNFRNRSKNRWAQSVYQVFTVACSGQPNRFLEITWTGRKDHLSFLWWNTKTTSCISYKKKN